MTDLVSNLLSFPPEKRVSAKEFDKQATQFVQSLSQAQPSTFTKLYQQQNVLDYLNPTLNSLAYLYAILAQCQAAGKDRARNDDAATRSMVFFTSFDPVQVRYAGAAWRELFEWGVDVYPRLGYRDAMPLVTGMLRLDPRGETFTSNHLRVVRMCLDLGVPSQALPILDKNITSFPQTPPKGVPDEYLVEMHEHSNAFITPKSGFTLQIKPEYVLEYYLLGAQIYIGLRNFARARLFLEYCILTPSSQHAAAIMQMEAYKKWILIGLLAQGKSYSLPRTHDAQVMKTLKATSRAYEALADAFEKRDWRKFQAEMDVGTQVWHDDGNFRLVREAGEALLRYRVLDLQKTFAALPVSRVAQHVDLTEKQTLQMLDDMIRQNYLPGAITASSTGAAVLTFTSTSASSARTTAGTSSIDLEAQTQRIDSLISSIRDADRRLQLTKEYVDFTKRSKKSAQAGGPDGDIADQMDLSWDAPIVIDDDEEGESGDEDIMAA